MANTPDLSALSAYAGSYEKKLFSTLVNELDAIKHITVIPDVKNKLNLTKLTVAAGARPYTVGTTSRAADLAYSGRVLEVTQGKRDLEIEPLLYRPTWQSLVMAPGVNPMDIPFAGYVWNQVMKGLAAEINNSTVFFGFDKSTATAYSGAATYSATTPDYITFTAADGIDDYWKCIVATSAGQSPTTHPAKWQKVNAEAIAVGLAKRIAIAVAASELSPVATGAITSSNAVAKIEQMAQAMPVAYRNIGFNVYVSYDIFDKYQIDYRDKFKKYVEMNEAGQIYVDTFARRVELIPCTWMGASQRVICSPKENLLLGTDRISDLNKINTFQKLRTLEAGIDFVIGTQIRDTDAMRVNDQADVI